MVIIRLFSIQIVQQSNHLIFIEFMKFGLLLCFSLHFLFVPVQAAQTHVAREGCNVMYITYVTRRCRVTDDR